MSDTNAGDATTTDRLELEVSAEETSKEKEAAAVRAILGHPFLRMHFPAADLWVVGLDVADKDDGEGARFFATVHDAQSGRAARVDGWLDDPDSIEIRPVAHQRPPTDDEHAWAVSVLADDAELGGALASEDAAVYRPLPPLANVESPDGTVDRVVTVGIRTVSADGRPHHRIVGVHTGDGAIVAAPAGVTWPPEEDHGPPWGPPCASEAGEGQARVRVRQGDTVLWDLVVVRPRASSGTNGSGVELRAVDFRGQRVLSRAHLPIVTTAYRSGDEQTGGYGWAGRDWLYEETCFEVEGTDAVPGFRVCSCAPGTILDTGADTGGFRGVALWLDGTELVVTSQLRAGWHRYVTEWRLAGDGTIRPRVGVTAVANPATGHAHTHHAYWRLDFDVLGADGNVIQEFNDPPVSSTASWHTVHHEVRRRRSAEHGRFWRVRNIRASQGYALRPGGDDGTADDFGAGDVWVLRHHPEEVDDGEGLTWELHRARVGLDRLVSGESVERQDLVVWYGVHVEHRSGGTAPARVGPDLVPYQWKEAPPAPATFAPLAPPTSDDLRPPGP